MPVGPYATFEACVIAQRDKGHDGLSARRICGAIEKNMHEDIAETMTLILGFAEAEQRARQALDLGPPQLALRQGMAAAWRRQGLVFADLFVRAYRAQESLREADTGSRWERLLEQAEDAVAREMRRVIRTADGSGLAAGWRRALGRVSVEVQGTFDLDNPRAVAFMEQHGAELVTQINETTRTRLRELLTGSMKAGWDIPQTARAIRREFYGFGDARYNPGKVTRAETVARTETAAAYSEGTLQSAQDLEHAGVAMEKAWLPGPHTDDEPCISNAEAGYLGLGTAFPAGAQRPPQHPHCVCALTTRVAPGFLA